MVEANFISGIYGLGTGQNQCDALRNQHHRQCRNHGLNAKTRNEQTVDPTKHRTGKDAGQYRQPDGQMECRHAHGSDDARHGHAQARSDIDATRGDGECHTKRLNARHRGSQ